MGRLTEQMNRLAGEIHEARRQRGEREGMLAGLMEPLAGGGEREGPKHHYLRRTAHRGAMDYLTQIPPDISRPIPNSLDAYAERAEQLTSLLDDILHQQPPPPLLQLRVSNPEAGRGRPGH